MGENDEFDAIKMKTLVYQNHSEKGKHTLGKIAVIHTSNKRFTSEYLKKS